MSCNLLDIWYCGPQKNRSSTGKYSPRVAKYWTDSERETETLSYSTWKLLISNCYWWKETFMDVNTMTKAHTSLRGYCLGKNLYTQYSICMTITTSMLSSFTKLLINYGLFKITYLTITRHLNEYCYRKSSAEPCKIMHDCLNWKKKFRKDISGNTGKHLWYYIWSGISWKAYCSWNCIAESSLPKYIWEKQFFQKAFPPSADLVDAFNQL